ncbi:hypothetical protein VPH35_007069 [Triticum aestivum]
MSWFILGVVLLAGGVPVVAEFAGGCVMLWAVCRSMEVHGAARRPRWLRRHGEEAAEDLRSGGFNDDDGAASASRRLGATTVEVRGTEPRRSCRMCQARVWVRVGRVRREGTMV